jgi:predicted ATPase
MLIEVVREQRAQCIIATHSPILMAYPDAWIYACSADGIERIEYRDTEHFRVMHDFIVNPKRMLDVLLAPEDAS